MGGGDLNMKKSWHPLLLKNQERVWLEEKKALEEKKKLDQLRKEKEEERQLQELQRMQEEQTGKKRTEKLEWMYSTPATGSSQNPNDLEDYLLGKKRVDKILTADEHAKLGASHKNFIAVQNANNARDIAAKIREDPLLAIKQQEQAAYQSLLSNPLRLREMQERNGIKPKLSKEEKRKAKEEKKRSKHERRRHRDSRSRSPRRRSPSPEDDHHRSRRSRYDSRSPRRDDRGGSPARRDSERYDDRPRRYPRSDESDEHYNHSSRTSHRHSPEHKRPRSRSPQDDRRRYSPPPKRFRSRSPPPRSYRDSVPSGSSTARSTTSADDRAARLAAMSSNATQMNIERQKRLAALLEKEKAELVAEEEARKKSKGMGDFLNAESKKVYGGEGGLEDRIRRGRGVMVSID